MLELRLKDWDLRRIEALTVLTDERLDALAERFLAYRVREITGCTFGQYLACPEAWDAHFQVVLAGVGLSVGDLCAGPLQMAVGG